MLPVSADIQRRFHPCEAMPLSANARHSQIRKRQRALWVDQRGLNFSSESRHESFEHDAFRQDRVRRGSEVHP